MTSKIHKIKDEGEMDRFLQESCRSYKECEIKNTARRNSLQRRTLGIETERKLASANISREERHLREQLKMMKIEKAKNDMMHNMRGIVYCILAAPAMHSFSYIYISTAIL